MTVKFRRVSEPQAPAESKYTNATFEVAVDGVVVGHVIRSSGIPTTVRGSGPAPWRDKAPSVTWYAMPLGWEWDQAIREHTRAFAVETLLEEHSRRASDRDTCPHDCDPFGGYVEHTYSEGCTESLP